MKVDIENMIQQIVEKSGKSKEQIQAEIQEEIENMGGFLSEEGAVLLIAKEYEIRFEKEEDNYEKRLFINELVPGMNSISVVGRIAAIFPINEFKRKDGSPGKVGNILLKDRTGQIRLALWDKHTEFIEDKHAEIGKLIEITSANVKTGYKGETDMNIGKKGQIKFDPEVNLDDYPEIKSGFLKIGKIETDLNNVSVIGKVVNEPSIRNITTKDGREIKLLEVVIGDKTGQIKIPFWGDKINLVKNIKKDAILQIEGAYSKEGFNNSIDLNIGFSSKLKLNPKTKKATALKSAKIKKVSQLTSGGSVGPKKIGSLTPNSNRFSVTFKCIEIEPPRQVKDGLTVANVLVGDETGVINLNVWNEKIDLMKKGESYVLKNAYVNTFQNKMKLNQSKSGILEISKTKIQKINKANNVSEKDFEASSNLSRKRINELKPNDFVEIRGSILSIPSKKPFYEACPKCNKKVSQKQMKYFCEKCNEEVVPTERIFYSIVVDDGFDNIKMNMGGKIGEKLLGMDIEGMKSILEEELTDDAPVLSVLPNLLGKELIFKGKVRFSDFSKNNELSVNDFSEPNTEDEINILLGDLEKES